MGALSLKDGPKLYPANVPVTTSGIVLVSNLLPIWHRALGEGFGVFLCIWEGFVIPLMQEPAPSVMQDPVLHRRTRFRTVSVGSMNDIRIPLLRGRR